MTNDLIQIQNGKVAFDTIDGAAPATGGCGSSGCGSAASTPVAASGAATGGCGSGCGCGSKAVSSAPAFASAASFIPLNAVSAGAVSAAPAPMEIADARAKLQDKKGPEYWRSLNELAQSPQFDEMMTREFRSAPASWQGVSRRDFLKLAGASLALAGLAGCVKQPEEKIHPYVKQPEDLIPGRPLFFATAASKSGAAGLGYAIGVLGESHMGRPTKLEGNPDHPSSLGRTDAITQATLYTLYDPDRSQNVTRNGEASSWDSAKGELTNILAGLRGTRGEGLRILTETVTSPTLAAQMAELLRVYPAARWHVWDAVNHDNRRAALGAADPVYRFDRAKVIVSLDSNFLQDEPGSVRYAFDYSEGRRVRARQNKTAMNRLYTFESTHTITGANADHRWPVKSSEVRAIAQRLLPGGGGAGNLPAAVTDKDIAAIAADLQANRGASLVIAGPTQPPEVHALAHRINVALGNVGKTVTYVEPVEANPVDNLTSLRNLVSDMNAGRVSTLVVLGANPVYSAPADLKFLDAYKKVKTRVRLGLYNDETSNWSHWHLPLRHFLEDWSDARAHDGTVSIVQPVISPLYDGISAHQLLSVMTGRGDRNPYNIVREYWTRRAGGNFEPFWRKALNDGVIANTASRPVSVSVRATPSTPALAAGLEINFYPDPHIWDGMHANNGWLQELPKPITRMTWDNAALVSLRTARELNIENYDIVKLTAGGNTVEAPIWIVPGQPDNQVTVHLGYGRERVGQMGEGAGFNAYALRTSTGLHFAGGVKIEKTGRQARLGITQENHMIDNRVPTYIPGAPPSSTSLQRNEDGVEKMDSFHGRDIIRVIPIAEFRKNPKGGHGHGEEHGGGEGKGTHGESTHSSGPQGASTHGEEHGAKAGGEGHGEAEGGHVTHPVGSPHEPNLLPRIWQSDRQSEDENGVPVYKQDKSGPSGTPVPQWAMTIDLNTCIGCNACTIACQAENNIPTVGKDEVIRGREMHWIRVDRYFRGDVANPESYHQPMACQHCEKAPCEPVCPVEATSHSREGINEMTYNRCVGTKYCANNCPYKVRRFNFLQYSEQDSVTISMMHNPDVTVRSRGVMEKCTFCIQRINDARWQAEKEDRAIRDGEFTTACAQTCPTNAIIFGNLNDRKSAVYESKAEPHNYGVLTELNTFPRTTYLAKLRNPNPALETAVAADSAAAHH